MSDIVKKVNRGVPPTKRSQSFTSLDAAVGDVLMVEDSLGQPAHYARIKAQGGAMSVRLNVYQKVFQNRQHDALYREDLPNTASGLQYVDHTTALIHIESNTILELDRELAISDIELNTASGYWDILVI